jgi:hypothetical protein
VSSFSVLKCSIKINLAAESKIALTAITTTIRPTIP